jgi:hypothetical protein
MLDLVLLRRLSTASVELWAGLVLVVGAIVPWFVFVIQPIGEPWIRSGTDVGWGFLPLVAGWLLVTDAARHSRAGTEPDRPRTLGLVVIAATGLIGGIVWQLVRDPEASGLVFRSMHPGFAVPLIGVLIGVAAARRAA